MNKVKYHSDAFLSNWVAGNLTTEEREEFALWLQENPEEQPYFEEIESLWNLTDRLKIDQGRTADQRWQLLQQNIETEAPLPRKAPVIRMALRIAIPAAAVLIIFFWYQLFTIHENPVVVAALDQVETIILPDSSVVRLNAGAKITYQKNLWEKERRLNLEGEAFFDVRKRNIPFIVQTGYTVTKVMGTSFNINAAAADSVAIACFTGKVAVSNPAFKTTAVHLTAGWGSIVKKAQVPSSPAPVDRNRISWSTGILSFQASPIDDVITAITKHYGVRIELRKKAPYKFTGVFVDKPLTEVLEIICFANNLSFSGSSKEGYIIF